MKIIPLLVFFTQIVLLLQAQPIADKVHINHSSGFYSAPFWITLSTANSGEPIHYTLDGSDPRMATHAIKTESPHAILIDPSSSQGGRGKTGGVVVRATSVKEGFLPSPPTTLTFIFLNHVINKFTHPGGSWPTYNINNQSIDLLMDSRVVNDARYKNLMADALLDIPTLSVTTDPAHLFDPLTGIYVNAKYDGREWERPANLELINPDGSPGFNIDAGIRIRGGWSRHPEFAKHAFRFYFRTEYGEGKLRFPLFEEEGVRVFDKIDLRTAQNYSWSKGGSEGKHNTFNRDVFSRDTQRAMNQPYTRSRYYHLYLNGLYWGIFQTQERAEASFAQSYLGGQREDYDVIKVEVGTDWNLYQIEATDGDTRAWREIWDYTQQGFSSNAAYFRLLGSNALGVRDPSIKVLLDVDNLIDYMLIIFYGGNFDAPVSKFSGNNNPNNFYAIYNRENPNEGFKFFIHDAEHSLLTDGVGPGIGLYENRVNIGSAGLMNVTSFSKFHPQWLHYRLSQNQEYRIRFADRVYRHFFNEGVLIPDSAINRFMRTASRLDIAIIAESARWGDVGVSTPRTRDDDWLPAVNRVTKSYMPVRTQIVLDQLKAEGLYNTILTPPVFKNNNRLITSYRISISSDYALTLENPNTNGKIYYTTNGKDPRAVGGHIAAGASEAGTTAVFIKPGQTIRARVKWENFWSPLHELEFSDATLFTNLRITELHYNPPSQGTTEGGELEFLELKNTGPSQLDLSGMAFTTGITFTFPTPTLLPPGSFVVLASNADAFTSFYGMAPSFEYSGQLSNSGEKIVLQNRHKEPVISFTYSDKAPWPTRADGGGFSLVSYQINPTGDPAAHDYWRQSFRPHGSPFADDEISTGTSALSLPELFTLSVFPNPATSFITIHLYLRAPQRVSIQLYTPEGKLLETITEEFFTSGNHSRTFPTHHFGAGIYILVARGEKQMIHRKVIFR
jgi:hypothetical protein